MRVGCEHARRFQSRLDEALDALGEAADAWRGVEAVEGFAVLGDATTRASRMAMREHIRRARMAAGTAMAEIGRGLTIATSACERQLDACMSLSYGEGPELEDAKLALAQFTVEARRAIAIAQRLELRRNGLGVPARPKSPAIPKGGRTL